MERGTIDPALLHVMHSPCHQNADKANGNHGANDPKEGSERLHVFEWDPHVHPECAADEVEGNQNRGQERNLAESPVRLCALGDIVDG